MADPEEEICATGQPVESTKMKPVTFQHVFQEELKSVNASRIKRRVPKQARPDNLIGLAFSGGGIRSATFNLGILQALARKRILHRFDYLSTVSGGGYIGSWFAALAYRFLKSVQGASFHDVETWLLDNETSALRWLRHYSNFLTPRTGAVSADTWATIATRFRNVFLTHIILGLGLSGLCLILDWTIFSLVKATDNTRGLELLWVGSTLLFFTFIVAASDTVAELPHHSSPIEELKQTRSQRLKIKVAVILPFVAGCVSLNCGLWARLDFVSVPIGWWALAGASFYFVIWGIVAQMSVARRLIVRRVRRSTDRPVISTVALMLFSPLAGAGGGCALWAYELLLNHSPSWTNISWVIVVFGSGVVMFVVILATTVHLALLGRGLMPQGRDSATRTLGQLLLAAIVWTLSASLVEFGPLLIRWLRFSGMSSLLLTLAAGLSLLGVFAARSGRTGEKLGTPPLIARSAKFAESVSTDIDKLEEADWKHVAAFLIKLPIKLSMIFTSREVMGVVATFVPYVYAVGLLLLVSTAAQISRGLLFDFPEAQQLWASPVVSWPRISEDYWVVVEASGGDYNLVIAAILLFSALAISWRLDNNSFSVNYFFQSRLVRYYLGASNPNRKPQPSTGLDPADDLPLSALAHEYCGPYPILNATLNVTTSRELGYTAVAKSFVFTPLYSGYDLALADAFDRTQRYLPSYSSTAAAGSSSSLGAFPPLSVFGDDSRGGVSLGTAMVISGAGANRYSGHYPVLATSVFMRLFDVRLGWWIGNPLNAEKWRRGAPEWGLLSSAIPAGDPSSGYIYLTDGGHFDNLGVYELIKRRCRIIVACDAEFDADYNFEDVAALVEKVRADFGVQIRLDLDQLRPAKSERQSECNFVVGDVLYDLSNPDDRGKLVYVKIGMPKSPTHAEASDVLPHDVWHYFKWHKAFPHEATARQWFDEQQFESYRALGEYIGGQVAAEIARFIEKIDR